MASQPMYQKVEDEESAENLPIIYSPPTSYQRLIQNISPKNWNIKAHPFATALTVLLCLSFALNILTWSRIGATKEGEKTVKVHELQYGKDVRYMSLHHNYDHLWNRIGSDHGGLIKYPLPGSKHPGRDAPLGVMSMFHQLHCVSSLRNALQNAYYGMGVAFDQTENSHWPHCLDYLRKSILCGADDTMEREKIVNGTRTFKIDGLTDTRQCRDTKHMYDLLRSKGLPDAKGPLGDVDDDSGEWWINS